MQPPEGVEVIEHGSRDFVGQGLRNTWAADDDSADAERPHLGRVIRIDAARNHGALVFSILR